jgi:hypothetical protein
MRLLPCIAVIGLIASACNQNSGSSSENKHMPVADVKAENLKGKISQVETETYLVDSATGKMGKLESKSIEKYNDDGYTVSYSNYTAKDSATTLNTYDIDAKGYFRGVKTTKNDKPLSSMAALVDSGKYTLATSYDSAGKVDVFYDDIVTNDYGQVASATGHHADSSLKMTFQNNFDSIYYVGGESKDSVGKVTYSSMIKLDDKRNPTQTDETTVTKDSTTKKSTTYAYDSWDNNGNWTQQTATENGKPAKIIKRTITYKQ